MPSGRLGPSALLLALLALAACKSADQLYNEGQDLEMKGRLLEAAHRYADALEKQPDLQKARGRLFEAGRLATDQLLERIERAPSEADAADLVLDLDRLLSRAAALGVTLPVPEAYPEARRATLDAAVEELIAGAEAEAARGRFEEALRRLDRARRYRPSTRQAEALDAAAADLFLGWAEADLAAGRFRAAHEHAEAALALARAEARQHALALQAEALERGSLRAALLPVWSSRAAARTLPEGFLHDLNDALEHEHWSRPPLFIRIAHPGDVGRVLRSLGLQRRALSTAEAARLGLELDAHLVLAGERVTFYRLREDVALRAEVTLEVVDPRRYTVVCERTISHTARGHVERGEYEGNRRLLTLSRADHPLFDAAEIERQERRIEDDLREALAQRIAQDAFECLTRGMR